MHLKTIFNRVTDYKPFVAEHIAISEDSLGEPTIEITMRARENGLPTCSGCGERHSGYDTLAVRRFDFIPLWLIPVVLIYSMRRVNCPRCGVKVERVPWVTGKSRLTIEYQWFLAGWARRMSWKEVAECFHVSWDHVYNSVKYAVSWGMSQRSLDGIAAIGVDEVQ